MPVVPSSLVAVEDAANAPELWAMGWLFHHNWMTPVAVSSAWRTDAQVAPTGVPQRRGAVIKPYRSITFSAVALTEQDVALLQSAMLRTATSGTLVPLFCDPTFLDSRVVFGWSASSGGANCGSSGKRTSPPVRINVNGESDVTFVGSSDGIAMLIGEGDAVTESYVAPVYDEADPESPVLVTPGRVTVNIPADAIIFGQTNGDLRTRSGCFQRITNGTNTFDLDRSADGVTEANVGVTTADMAGFDVRAWSTPVPVADLQSRGWVGEDGVARMRLVLLASGSSGVSAQIDFSELPVLACETADRRFFDGGLVVISEDMDGMRARRFEVAQIDFIGDGFLALKTPLTQFFGVGSRVMPLIECDVTIEGQLTPRTDNIVEATLTFRERVGKSQLPSLVQPGLVPEGFPSYQGYPILYSGASGLQPHVDWSQPLSAGVVRELVSTPVGPDQATITYGAVPRRTHTRPYLSRDRARAFDLLRLFDSRAGALFPFFVVDPTTIFTATAIGTGTVTVVAAGPSRDWTYRRYLAVLTTTGDLYVREVASVARDGVVDVVTLLDVIPMMALAQVLRVTLAHLVLSQSDEITEQWTTDQHMVSSLAVVEADGEKTVSIEVPAIGPGTTLPPAPEPTGGPGANPPPPGDPVPYRRARDLCTGVPIDLWIPADTAPAAPEYVGGFDPTSGRCFTVDPNDPTTLNPPGDVPAGWEPLPSATDPFAQEVCGCKFRLATPCAGESGAAFSVPSGAVAGGSVIKYADTCYTVSELQYVNPPAPIVESGWTSFADCDACNPPPEPVPCICPASELAESYTISGDFVVDHINYSGDEPLGSFSIVVTRNGTSCSYNGSGGDASWVNGSTACTGPTPTLSLSLFHECGRWVVSAGMGCNPNNCASCTGTAIKTVGPLPPGNYAAPFSASESRVDLTNVVVSR
ncbi:MAG TPA: hypothetical protein VGN72_10055 [Tepidisphaeraceae bacterium]|jgi:hypothetical protein|nr:hypothetical protein [Tepidisphaeraceae bacterium]